MRMRVEQQEGEGPRGCVTKIPCVMQYNDLRVDQYAREHEKEQLKKLREAVCHSIRRFMFILLIILAFQIQKKKQELVCPIMTAYTVPVLTTITGSTRERTC